MVWISGALIIVILPARLDGYPTTSDPAETVVTGGTMAHPCSREYSVSMGAAIVVTTDPDAELVANADAEIVVEPAFLGTFKELHTTVRIQ